MSPVIMNVLLYQMSIEGKTGRKNDPGHTLFYIDGKKRKWFVYGHLTIVDERRIENGLWKKDFPVVCSFKKNYDIPVCVDKLV